MHAKSPSPSLTTSSRSVPPCGSRAANWRLVILSFIAAGLAGAPISRITAPRVALATAEETPGPKAPTEPATAKPPPSEKLPSEKLPSEKPPSEKPPSEKPPSEKPPSEKPPSEKPTSEKPTAEKTSAEKPSAEKSSTETATRRALPLDGWRDLIARYCVDCHGAANRQANLRLDQLAFALEADTPQASTERAIWWKVLDRVRAGEMPPASATAPDPAMLETPLQTLADELRRVERQRRAVAGRVSLRRLNRNEYENTINDLLGVRAKLRDSLPLDGVADGFDNASAANHTSSFLLEKYLESADTALELAIANRPVPPPSASKRYSLKDGHPVRNTTEDVYRFGDDGEVTCFCSSEWHNVSVSPFYPSEAGLYRFRIAASAVQSDGKPVTFRVTASGARLTGKSGLIGYFDALPGEPKVFEFERWMEPRTTISVLPYGLAHANTVKQQGGKAWQGPGLSVRYVEIEGPLNAEWPPASHRRLFGDLPRRPAGVPNFRDRVEVVSEASRTDAERLLVSFLRPAFRRAVRSEDAAPFIAIVEQRLAAGATFEQAMRAAYKGVLVAPEFLFLRESPGKLDDAALAARLSFFLWSSLPDDELLDLAERGKLGDPDTLRRQVERLLNHPRAAAFTENFAGQWLGLRDIDATEPSHLLYPEFDHLLKVSMIRETELYFEELLRHDLGVARFIDADFTFLNGRLARHYGIEGPTGWEFQRFPLPADSPRGGLLTMASVLKVTSNGTTTSPVIRGAWVLDRILGTPAPPPPENVAAIDPDIRGASTIREQLAKHRADASCAVCHRRIDPPGFALESFDCIGGWRDRYRVTGNGDPVTVDGRRMPYHRGKAVDPTGEWIDGSQFANVREWKRLLIKEEAVLARAFVSRLIAYGTGRAPTRADQEEVAAIADKTRAGSYGVRSLIHEVVQSDLFRHK